MKNLAFGIGRALEVTHAKISKAAAPALIAGLLCAAPAGSQAVTFTGAGMTFNDPGTVSGTTVVSNPYPGTINVSGLANSIINITLTLNGFVRTSRPDDLDMLLVSPAGRTFFIWSDVGGVANTSTGVLNITLSDTATNYLPDNGPLASGTFKPTNEGAALDQNGAAGTGNFFPAPAPQPPAGGNYGDPGGAVGGTHGGPGLGSFASQFNFTNPNGTWSLYIIDDAITNGLDAPENGSFTSWQLDIIAVPEPGTWALLAAGGVAMAYFLRRSRLQRA